MYFTFFLSTVSRKKFTLFLLHMNSFQL
jgi:hypothetical protein